MAEAKLVDISGLPKTAVLAALHNNAQVFGMGIRQAIPGDITVQEIQRFIDDGDDRTRMFQSIERSNLDFQCKRSILAIEHFT